MPAVASMIAASLNVAENESAGVMLTTTDNAPPRVDALVFRDVKVSSVKVPPDAGRLGMFSDIQPPSPVSELVLVQDMFASTTPAAPMRAMAPPELLDAQFEQDSCATFTCAAALDEVQRAAPSPALAPLTRMLVELAKLKAPRAMQPPLPVAVTSKHVINCSVGCATACA